MRKGIEGRALAAILLLLVVGGCGSMERLTDADRPAPPERLFSPNGEPLRGGPLGHPSCRAALSGWFDRTDTNHQGFIDRAAFRADAQRQFAAMDLDHNGEVTPDELARYRAPYEADTSRRIDAAADDGKGKHRDGGRLAVEQPDPVMLADVDLRNRVTRAQFLAYAEANFTDLDKRRDGRLDKAEITSVCGAAEDGG